MDNDRTEELLAAACRFQGQSLEQRQRVNEKYREKETSEENILRILIDGLIASLAMLMAEKVNNVTPAVSYQIAIAASYVRTHFIVNDFILQGDLVEAMTLVRKQLESLARLRELDSRPFEKLIGKVPNIQNVLKGPAGRVYGQLSEVAHFSKPEVGELLHVLEKGELVGPSLLPAYTDKSHACFDIQAFIAIYFLAWLVEKLPAWYPAYDNTKDRGLIGYIVVVAKDTGVIRLPADDAPQAPPGAAPRE
jgi:hypothetical protein